MQFDSGGVGKILVYINVLIYPYLTRFLFMKPTKFRSVKLYIDQKGNMFLDSIWTFNFVIIVPLGWICQNLNIFAN